MTMLKRLTVLLCASIFFLSQPVVAGEQEGMAADKAAEAAKEMSQEATAAGTPTDAETMKKSAEAMQGESEQDGKMKDEMPANKAETKQ
jgi:tetrahydromethanopterin S-methyltransferase subunit H